MFVGEHRAVDALFVEALKDFFGARKQGNAIEHVFIPERSIDGHGLSDEIFTVRTHQPANGHFQPASDHPTNLLQRRRRESQLRHGVRVRAVDGGEMVEQGSVEVEKRGAK